MRRYRLWPKWVCWFWGHEPTEQANFSMDTVRCRCGAVEVAREHTVERGWWARVVSSVG